VLSEEPALDSELAEPALDDDSDELASGVASWVAPLEDSLDGSLVADEDDSEDFGACAGGVIVLCVVVCEEDPFVLLCAELVVLVELLFALPGNACAATSVSTPVSATLPAISQRLAADRRRSAASRVWLENWRIVAGVGAAGAERPRLPVCDHRISTR
jgi:hypothetical protein